MNTVIYSKVILEQLTFAEKPTKEEREALFNDGYRWARGAWTRTTHDSKVSHVYEGESHE